MKSIPLPDLARFFAQLGNWLILEFVPKEDSQVQRLLATRLDIFPNYTTEGLDEAFRPYFDIRDKHLIEGSKRTLYLMCRTST